MNIRKTSLPAMSALNHTFNFSDYTDSYFTELNLNGNEIELEELVTVIFMCSPPWAARLLDVRNKIAGVFGLKRYELPARDMQKNISQENAGQYGVFKVFFKNRHELIMGTNDRHLNFRVSLLVHNSPGKEIKEISISTVVKFNNRVGRFYFFFVKPIHRRIVPALLRGIAGYYEIKTGNTA